MVRFYYLVYLLCIHALKYLHTVNVDLTYIIFICVSVIQLVCMAHLNSVTECYSYVWYRFEFWKRSLQPLPPLTLIPTKRSWRWPWSSAFSAYMPTPVRRAKPASLRTTHRHRSNTQILIKVTIVMLSI